MTAGAFAFPDELLSQHVAIVGKVGSGKTYTSKGMVERLLASGRRVCILDPTGVWWGLRSNAAGKGAGFPVVVFGGTHADVRIAEGSGAALARIVAAKNVPAIVDLSEMLIGGRHRFMTDFAEALYRDNRQPLHLVIDEADEFAPQNPMPETKRMLHHVDRIVRRGRVRGFRVMLITQRPAVLHKNVLTQANTLIAMRLTAPQDRNAIKAWIEGQADAVQGKAVLDSLPRLQRGEGWVWAPELNLLERVAFPKIATFDSSRTPENDEAVLEPTKLAAVDLGEIKASFAAIEEEAKTLEELRAEVAALKRKLTIAEKAGGTPGKALELSRQAGFEQGLKQAAPPPAAPVVSKALLAGVERIAAGLQAVQAELAGVSPGIVPRARTVAPAPQANGHDKTPRAAPGPVHAGVSAPQQRILDSIAALEAFGVPEPEKETLAAHAGVPHTSGGYRNNLSALRTAGLIEYPSPGTAALTASGRQKANPPSKAPTLNDLHGAWLRLVSNPQRQILAMLIAAWPEAVSKDELAARCGVPSTSGGYRNNLSRLRTMRAIDYPSPGSARAAAVLFPKGAS
jgi:hypothetical protein